MKNVKNLEELYNLLVKGELKKEDLIDVDQLFANFWNNSQNYDEDYTNLYDEYAKNFDISQEYGIAQNIYVTIKTISTNDMQNRYELEFFVNDLNCESFNDHERTINITNETKNELAKNNVQKHKILDECVLKAAVFQAAKTYIINDEIQFLQAEAE